MAGIENFPAIASIQGNGYATTLASGKHILIADEPIDLGGTDKGPTPGDYLRMALASCTTITLRMYANRKEWNVDEIKVTVDTIQENTSTLFKRNIEIKGNLDDVQRKRMLQIANACPVHKVLSQSILIETQIH